MELTIWIYEGPHYIGAMTISTSIKKLHYVLHTPQPDTYADLLFTMIDPRANRPPVTYTTFQTIDLKNYTAKLIKIHIKETVNNFNPNTLLV